MKNQTGIILLSALIILMLLSLLVIAGANTTQISAKWLQNEDIRQQTFYAAETGLSQVTRFLLQEKVPIQCQYGAKTPDYFIYQTQEWWNSNATCQLIAFSNFSLRYVVEKLIDSGCLQVQVGIDDIRRGGRYWRITLLAMSSDGTETVLQSTMVMPLAKVPKCRVIRAEILKVGRQSWKEVEK